MKEYEWDGYSVSQEVVMNKVTAGAVPYSTVGGALRDALFASMLPGRIASVGVCWHLFLVHINSL